MNLPQRPNGAMMECLVLFKTLSHTIVRFDPVRLASGEYLRLLLREVIQALY
jgi:hypothetical protein